MNDSTWRPSLHPPGMPMKTREVCCVLAMAALLTAVVFSPAGGDWLWSRRLHDFAHGPIFGSLALLTLFFLRARSSAALSHQYLTALLVAFTLGGITELLQTLSQRDPSWADLGMDALGATAFLSIFALFDKRINVGTRRRVVGPIVVAATVLLMLPLISTAFDYSQRARAFPIIVDFSRGIGNDFWTTRQVNARIVRLPKRFSSRNERALRVEFLPGRWQGLDLREPPRDWQGYEVLLLDVVNPTPDILKIVLRIDDRGYNGPYIDRYNGRFEIPAFTRSTIHIPFSDIESAPRGRKFNISNITRVLLFRQHESKASEMYVVGMRLSQTASRPSSGLNAAKHYISTMALIDFPCFIKSKPSLSCSSFKR